MSRPSLDWLESCVGLAAKSCGFTTRRIEFVRDMDRLEETLHIILVDAEGMEQETSIKFDVGESERAIFHDLLVNERLIQKFKELK